MPLALALVLHAHQPAGNFEHVIEQTYQSSYRPFLEAIAPRASLRFTLHYTGFLLDWLAQHHPEHLDLVRQLVAADRVEILGGGYYEPILAAIPPVHQQEQLRRLADAVERHFQVRPRGAWLAERVWQPELPAVLAASGVEYTILDDTHFTMAGIAPDDLHGDWITEAQGATVRVVPSSLFLRQAIPFQPVAKGLAWLLDAARRGQGLLAMGDDLEKFGAWPHTAQHVYAEGWLEHFFDGLEIHQDEIATVRLADYLDQHPARGLLYLPTASYPEMMAWAGSPCWRGFFTKYREANLLHKTLWDLYRRYDAATALAPAARAEIQENLLAAECNDVYWHGWFGGLYSPHLRNLAFTRLLAADRLLEGGAAPAAPRLWDLHRDGGEIVELRTPELRALVNPADGATIEELDFRPADANLLNSMRRRPEAYHDDLRRRVEHNPAQLPGAAGGPAPGAGPAGLEALLHYDSCPRSSGRLYLCPVGKTFADFKNLALDPDPAVATGAYTVVSAQPGRLSLACGAVTKDYTVAGGDLEIAAGLGPPGGGRFAALETVFNLLAPDAPDRYFEQAGQRYSLRWEGMLPPGPLTLWDGWRRVRITLEAPGAVAWWLQPLFTVSQADTGFEALYQGSALAAVWPPAIRQISLHVNFFR